LGFLGRFLRPILFVHQLLVAKWLRRFLFRHQFRGLLWQLSPSISKLMQLVTKLASSIAAKHPGHHTPVIINGFSSCYDKVIGSFFCSGSCQIGGNRMPICRFCVDANGRICANGKSFSKSVGSVSAPPTLITSTVAFCFSLNHIARVSPNSSFGLITYCTPLVSNFGISFGEIYFRGRVGNMTYTDE